MSGEAFTSMGPPPDGPSGPRGGGDGPSGGPLGAALERLLGKRLYWGRDLAQLRPVYEPQRNKKLEVGWVNIIFFGWIGYAALTFWIAGTDVGRTTTPIPFMIVAGIATWILSEWLVKRRGMIWPGSMLGLLGPASFALAFSLSTPEFRALPGLEYITIIYSTTTLGMMVYAYRFRLAGLISPITTFSVISLFLFFKGSKPENWAQIEGFSPRGFLAAFIDQPWSMAFFGSLALAGMIKARQLDVQSDWFGLQAARPLHVVSTAIVALVAGRLAEALPSPLDLFVLLTLFAAGFLYAMRIDRLPVLVAIWLAMARPLFDTFCYIFDLWHNWRHIAWGITAITASGLVLWGYTRQRYFVPIGWVMQPRHILSNWPRRQIWPFPKDLSRI
ncbi:MAG: hypothetical protein AAF675_05200 [Pseudomonadota bacterium]